MAKLRNRSYQKNGVTIYPVMPRAKERVKVTYKGLLAKNGATELYAHVGFGSTWRQISDYPMNRVGDEFVAQIPVRDAKQMHVCFKDAAEHWDNNSGENYSFELR